MTYVCISCNVVTTLYLRFGLELVRLVPGGGL